VADREGLREAASRLLQAGQGENRTLQALVEQFHRVAKPLQAGLARVLGSLTVRLLVSRAIREASIRHPSLSGALVHENGVEAWTVLDSRSDEDYAEVQEALEDLLACFLEALERLLGRELTLSMVREALEVAREHPPRKGEEEDEL